MIGKEENIHSSSSKFKSARIISYLLDGSVLVFPIFLTICFYGQDDMRVGIISFLISIFFASILPYSFIIFLYKKGIINDLHLPKRKDRILPIVVSLSCLITGYAFLNMTGLLFLIKHIFILYIFNLALVGLITLWWKISFHASYVTLFSVIFIYIYGKTAFPALLLIPLVCWARVVMKRHTIAQVIAGSLLTGTLSFYILYYNQSYTRLIRSDVIFDALKLSIAGNINISMLLTVLFIVLAGQFRKTRIYH